MRNFLIKAVALSLLISFCLSFDSDSLGIKSSKSFCRKAGELIEIGSIATALDFLEKAQKRGDIGLVSCNKQLIYGTYDMRYSDS